MEKKGFGKCRQMRRPHTTALLRIGKRVRCAGRWGVRWVSEEMAEPGCNPGARRHAHLPPILTLDLGIVNGIGAGFIISTRGTLPFVCPPVFVAAEDLQLEDLAASEREVDTLGAAVGPAERGAEVEAREKGTGGLFCNRPCISRVPVGAMLRIAVVKLADPASVASANPHGVNTASTIGLLVRIQS